MVPQLPQNEAHRLHGRTLSDVPERMVPRKQGWRWTGSSSPWKFFDRCGEVARLSGAALLLSISVPGLWKHLLSQRRSGVRVVHCGPSESSIWHSDGGSCSPELLDLNGSDTIWELSRPKSPSLPLCQCKFFFFELTPKTNPGACWGHPRKPTPGRAIGQCVCAILWSLGSLGFLDLQRCQQLMFTVGNRADLSLVTSSHCPKNIKY